MHRRHFVRSATLLTGYPLLSSMRSFVKEPFIMTVNGKLPAAAMGFSLIHEHVLVDFIGAAKITPGRYDIAAAFEKIKPYLSGIVKQGCKTFVECTPAYLGRDVRLLQRLSAETGLQVITNTGYYGAANEKFVPPFAYTQSAGEIAAIWTREYTEGIAGTGMRPGFIKSGVDNYPLSEIQQKLVEAAAITHLATGLSVAIHTGNGDAAREELRILKIKAVNPAAWIWVHAQNEKDMDYHYSMAKEGGWISFDGVSPELATAYVQKLKNMKEAGLLNKVLVSQDAGWYNVGDKDGGNYRSHTTIVEILLPALKQEGFTEEDIRQVFVKNPAEAFAISIKNYSGY